MTQEDSLLGQGSVRGAVGEFSGAEICKWALGDFIVGFFWIQGPTVMARSMVGIGTYIVG